MRQGKRAGRDAGAARLSFEALEDRQMLTTFVVNNLGDINASNGSVITGTLRWAINQANATDAGDTIVFDESLFQSGAGSSRFDGSNSSYSAATTINLSNHANGGELAITRPLTILGPGAAQLAIVQGKPNNRIFDINNGDDDVAMRVEVSGLTLRGGNLQGTAEEKGGGAIYSRESLTMTEDIVTNNSTQAGGGGVFVARGSLTVDRSLFYNNSAGVGGGIMNGGESDTVLPRTSITNSTFYGNSAFGVPDKYGAWGGGIFNRHGDVTVQFATITSNSAEKDGGGGIASYGNPVPDDDMSPVPPPKIFTHIGSSIVSGNTKTDVDRVGKDDKGDMPVDLMPSFGDPGPAPTNFSPSTLGFNIIGTGNITKSGGPDYIDPSMSGDMYGVDPLFYTDPDSMEILNDYGGSIPVILLDDGSPALDAGNPDAAGTYEQRGRQFTRVADNPFMPDGNPVPDIGAAEVQNGLFTVDTIIDELDRSFTRTNIIDSYFGPPEVTTFFNPYDQFPGQLFPYTANPPFGGISIDRIAGGDFSLREAIQFAKLNPGPDTIIFSPDFNDPAFLGVEDKNGTSAPTIILNRGAAAGTGINLGPLSIDEDLQIIGPSTFVLEIDGSGSDPNPNLPSGGGTRLLVVDDGDSTLQSVISISNLTFMGADFTGIGGGIYTTEDLTLDHVTVKNNNAATDGGGLYVQVQNPVSPPTITILGSTFNNNRAGHDGAGLFVNGVATVNITNSTFSGNFAGNRGGGIGNNNGHVIVEYSTFTLNNATSTFGSGINNTGASALTEVGGSIISGNVGNDINFSTGATVTSFKSLGYNFIGKGTGLPAFGAATHDITNNTNPMLEPLLNTGGIVATHRPIYRLDTNQISPVIDAGDPDAEAGVGDVPALDQRGVETFVRVFDVPGVGATQGPRIDIGSYELQGAVFTVDSSGDDLDGDYSFGNFSLREAISVANQNPLPDIITFDLQSIGGTISLNGFTTRPVGTPLDIRITTPMVITLLEKDLLNGNTLTIDGSGLFSTTGIGLNYARMFTINDNNDSLLTDVTFRGITFENGTNDDAGGAIWSTENLTLEGDTFFNNQTLDDMEQPGAPVNDLQGLHGGAVYQQGTPNRPIPTLTIRRYDAIDPITQTVTNTLLPVFSGNSTNDADADGGAIYVLNSTLVMSDTQVAGNSTKQGNSEGGAIAVKNSTVTSTNDVITGNVASAGGSEGGGLFSDNSVVTLTNDVVGGNQTNGSTSRGGAISAVNSTITISGTVISGNQTSGNVASGGGISSRLDTLRLATAVNSLNIDHSLITQNIASGPSAQGAGIYLNGGSSVIDFTTVGGNQLTGLGGTGAGIANVGSNLTFSNSTLSNNNASGSQSKGGGIYSDTSLTGLSTQIVNSTISGNTAKLRGGGVFNADGLLTISYSTITNNTLPPSPLLGDFNGDNIVDGADFLAQQRNMGATHATTAMGDANGDTVINSADLAFVKANFGPAGAGVLNQGSGVASMGNAATSTRVISSIISGNPGTDVDFVDGSTNSFLTQGYNLIGDGTALAAFNAGGFTDIVNNVDPKLGPLQDNGAALDNPFGMETHAVLEGSPAINAGKPGTLPVQYDQRGSDVGTGLNFTRVQGGRADIGAFESAFGASSLAASSSSLAAASQPATSAALVSEPDSANESGDAIVNQFTSLASMGTPGSTAGGLNTGSGGLAPEVVFDQAWASYRLAPATEGGSSASDDLDLLLPGEADGAQAADADDVFALLGSDLLS